MGFLTGLVGDLVGGQAGAMFKESVGYDPRMLRKISRLVGKKNLTMLGAGAALGGLAGTAVVGASSGGSGGGPSSWDAPRGPVKAPPNPPVASAPPPPPVPGGEAAASDRDATTPPLPPVPGSEASASTSSGPAGPLPTPVETPASTPGDRPPGAGEDDLLAVRSVDEVEAALPDGLTFAIARGMIAAALADGALDAREKSLVEGRLDDASLGEEQVAQLRRDLVIPPQPKDLAALVDDPDGRAAVYRFAGLVLLADGDVGDLERTWLDRLATAFAFDDARKEALEAEIFEPDGFESDGAA